jgi:hypothetical protein
MSFADKLRPHVERIGTAESARICGVTPRAIQLWLANPKSPPNAATQAGALLLLKKAKTPAGRGSG